MATIHVDQVTKSVKVAVVHRDIKLKSVTRAIKVYSVGRRGPQGETGPMGLTGAAGPQGIQGEQGEQGLQGEQGIPGSVADAPVTSVAGRLGDITLTKADVGLSNVDNTTDVAKPISSAAQTALNEKANTSSLSTVATTGSYDDLSDKPSIPVVSGTNTGDETTATIKTKLGITTLSGANTGDQDLSSYATNASVTSGLAGKANTVHTHTEADVTNLTADLAAKASAADLTSHTSNTSNPHSVTKTQVGLSNVDNTSDASKPISTATQTALDTKSDVGHTHVKADITDFSTSFTELSDFDTTGQVDNSVIYYDNDTNTYKVRRLATVADTGSYTDLSDKPTFSTDTVSGDSAFIDTGVASEHGTGTIYLAPNEGNSATSVQIAARDTLAMFANTGEDGTGAWDSSFVVGTNNYGGEGVTLETVNETGKIHLLAPEGVGLKSGGFTASVTADALTADRALALPDSSGTVATESYADTASSTAATTSAAAVRSRSAIVGLTSGDYPVSSYANASTAIAAALAANDHIYIKNGVYALTTDLQITASNKSITGESETGTILRLNTGVNKSVITTGTNTGIISNVQLRNLTIDQQGAGQTAGGGIVVVGIQGWTFENITLPVSFRFQLLVQSQGAVANKTGTVTFTNGSEMLAGSGTTFTTDLPVGSIVKEPTTGEFARVAKVISDTSVRLTRPWSFATQTGVTYKNVPANSNNNFINVKAYGTLDDRDNMGFGLCDYAVVDRCISMNASGAGCGFVPDHARGMMFSNCIAANNANAGFSYETCEDMLTANCISYGAGTGNGYQLISGGINCRVENMQCWGNASHGFAVNNNNASYPVPTRNSFLGVSAWENGGYGMRVDGANKTYVKGSFYNNVSGGYIQNTANSVVPADTMLDTVRCYDDRTTKQQIYGIWLVTGTNTTLNLPQSVDADHVTGGILDQATGTSMITAVSGNIGINNKAPANRLNVNTPTTQPTGAVRDAILASSAAASVPFAVEAAPSQTGNLMEFLSSAGNIIMNLTSGGLFRTATSAVATPAYSFAAEGGTGMGRTSGVANTLFLSTAANERVRINTEKTEFFHGMAYKRTAIGNTNYTVLVTDYLIEYTSISAPRTVTLPTAVGYTGQVYIIKDGAGAAGTSNLTIATTSSQTIDGASTATISVNYGQIAVYSDGANWKVFNKLTTKTEVGLSNVDNTADTAKPVSTAQQTALDLKANLTSPTLVTPTIGVATATSVNKVAITAPATSATLTIANGKTLTANNTLTLAGTDGTTMTFPSSTDTLAGLAAVQTITGAWSFNDAKLILKGVTSGTTTLKSGAAAGTSVITLPVATDTLVGKATTDTLTNKTIALGSNTVSGTLAQFNTAVTDADLAPIASPAFTGTPTVGNLSITSVAGGGQITGSAGGSFNVTDQVYTNAIDASVGMTINAVAVPTISSSSTLTNKTVNASNNTVTNVANFSVKRQNNTSNTTETGVHIETGWGVFAQGAVANKSETVTFNTAFSTTPIVTISYGGDQTGGTIALGNGGNTEKGPVTVKAYGESTTAFTAHAHTSDGTSWSATANVYYKWTAIGA